MSTSLVASNAHHARPVFPSMPCSVPLSDLVVDGPAGRLRLDHPCLAEEAASIASDGFLGTIHVTPLADDFRVVAGAHTVLALRYLVAFDLMVWDRRAQDYRPASDVYREVDCLVEVGSGR